MMLQTIEVEIVRDGQIHPVEPVPRLPAGRALLTLLQPSADETALLAEAALAEDWLKPEEDERGPICSRTSSDTPLSVL